MPCFVPFPYNASRTTSAIELAYKHQVRNRLSRLVTSAATLYKQGYDQPLTANVDPSNPNEIELRLAEVYFVTDRTPVVSHVVGIFSPSFLSPFPSLSLPSLLSLFLLPLFPLAPLSLLSLPQLSLRSRSSFYHLYIALPPLHIALPPSSFSLFFLPLSLSPSLPLSLSFPSSTSLTSLSHSFPRSTTLSPSLPLSLSLSPTLPASLSPSLTHVSHTRILY